MSRKSLGQLLQKYQRGECTPEEKSFVEHWYGLLEIQTKDSGEELNWDELEDKLWNQMQQKMHDSDSPDVGQVIPIHTNRYRWLGVAAAVLFIIGWFFMQPQTPDFLSINKPVTPVNPNWIEQTNSSSTSILVRLEDGSTVQLASQSTLRFPKQFASANRTVYLTGDAFFTIQKQPSRPFFVHTGSVTTKVLGTSFYIRTHAITQQIRVEVVTGRVAVYEENSQKQKNTNGVVLSPNQATTFFGDNQHFVTSLVEKPVLIQNQVAETQQLSFVFDDAPLSDVLARLEQAYGIAIEVENEQQANCPLTADLSNQPLFTQLDIICAALKSTYKIQGTTILISGKACVD